MATLLTKKSDTASSVPLAADLTNAAGGAELAVNTADKRLYSKTSGGTVVELGTNPSSMTLPNGTANGIPYLNGSKVLTSGSALTFDGTNLGVGVASPFRPLDVLQRTNDTTPAVLLRGYTTGADGARTVLVSAVSSDANNWANLTFSAQSHIWQYQGSEQMRLTSTGLGIGTSSPSYKLDVQLSGYPTAQVASTLASGANGAVFQAKNGGGAVSYFGTETTAGGYSYTGAIANAAYCGSGGANPLQLITNSAVRATFDTSGNLGLGVTPSAWGGSYKVLEGVGGSIISSGTSYFAMGQNYYNNGTSNLYKNTGSASLFDQTGGAFRWLTAPSGTAGAAISFTQAMTLDASGNLLVGTTSSATYGNGVKLSGSADAYASLGHSSGTTSGSGYVLFGYNGTGIGSITQNGTTGVLYNMVSDHRLKTVLGSITDSGARIDALEPIEYEWKSDGSRTRGFLAHKFQEIYAGSVTGSKDAVDKEGKPVYQAMQAGSSEVIADLVAEIQSLRKRLAAAGI